MIEHLYRMIKVITFNFISLKTSFVCDYKPQFPNIDFAYSAWTSFRYPSFDLEFKCIELFRLFYFIEYYIPYFWTLVG